MAEFRFTVDTDPMAHSLNNITHHVDGVTTAVVAMKTAVVLAEENAANNVCKNVNKGFYTLIRSQISQKIAKLRSDTDSKFMEMRQQSISLASIKDRMEKDYNMISRRYVKLFDSLNKSLRSRVFELDKPTAVFVNKEMTSFTNRIRLFLGSTPVNQTESIGNSQLIAATRTKFIGQKAIGTMSRFLSDLNQQKHIVKRILNKESASDNQSIFIPVILCESYKTPTKNSEVNYYLPESNIKNLTSILSNAIQPIIYSGFKSLNWNLSDYEMSLTVKQEYYYLLETQSLPNRTKDLMKKMVEPANWETL